MRRRRLIASTKARCASSVKTDCARRGQAMLETVFAVFFLTVVFLTLFYLARMLQTRILLDHAAARAARARAVGFNEFMCLKSARVAMIPVAGERVWPVGLSDWDEVSRIPIYLSTEHEATARGVLEYEHWNTMQVHVTSGGGLADRATADISLATDDFTMDGHAEIESHYPLYLHNAGR